MKLKKNYYITLLNVLSAKFWKKIKIKIKERGKKNLPYDFLTTDEWIENNKTAILTFLKSYERKNNVTQRYKKIKK